ncbi:uncharacterized protein LOC122859629 [Aphidius gifuensis]|uniref:uncharacterized protein LOC122859629 n=1 Tax=Aphidius gifuensis TaxID=684658 RepID=UPI001CDD2E7D|nr:uncharacterized protein LOC122859629 [Aphidius gifuensis]
MKYVQEIVTKDLCEIIIKDLIEIGVDGSIILNSILTQVDDKKTTFDNAKTMIRVLYEILSNYSWDNSEKTINSIEKLLTIYHSSINLNNKNNKKHATLKKGLELCIRNTIDNLQNDNILPIIYRMCCWTIEDNINNEIIHDFARPLEYAASIYKTSLLIKTFDDKLLPLLMKMISSNNRLISLLGNRVIQCLIDRNKNRQQFEKPRTFFKNINYKITLNNYNKNDELFYKLNRQIFHDSFVNSLMYHTSKLSLEATYCSICLLAVEIPCGFTAASLTCLIMNFQDLMIDQHVNIKREITYHVHAMVMSLMTLICWIHKAQVFYSYVDKIMMKRAQYAPHLNPPLLAEYDFAILYVLWDKPELFFVDWEVRYGLWKCFRSSSSSE